MKKNYLIITDILWTIIILLLFLITSRLYFKFDLTKNKINTLTEFTQKLCSYPDEPLIIRYLVSERFKDTNPLPLEISNLLDEYASLSHGTIRFISEDPQKIKSSELEKMGIYPRQMPITEKNGQILAPIYSSIIFEYLDNIEVLPEVFNSNNLEYEISLKIHSLINNFSLKLGVIISSSTNLETEYSLLNYELLKTGFNIIKIEAGKEIPVNLDCLLILGTTDGFYEDDLKKIDHYIQSGGNIFFAIDTVEIDYENGFFKKTLPDYGILAVLAAYGVVIYSNTVEDINALNLSYRIPNPDGSYEIATINYPQWISVSSINKNFLHPVSAVFNGLDLYWASPLELIPPPAIEAVPLFWSSNSAWLDDLDNYIGKKILGASLTGVFPSPFDTVRERQNEGRIIVTGNSLFAADLMSATGALEKNTDFIIRSILWLSHNDELLNLRKIPVRTNKLDKIEDPAKRNIIMDLSRILNVYILPAVIIFTGFIVTQKRKNK